LVVNATVLVLVDVVPEEVLDGYVSDVGRNKHALNIGQELEALFVADVGEGVVRGGAIKDWVESRVAVVHTIVSDVCL